MSSNLKLIPGRYTNGPYVGAVRYLDPSVGVLYEDAEGKCPANNGFMPLGGGRWAGPGWAPPGWEFIEGTPPTVEPGPYGYLICSKNGPAKVLHLTAAEAEAEAMRLASANVGVEFTITPVHLGTPVAKTYTPKPKPTLERL